MRVVGIDPGTRLAGYGIVDSQNRNIKGVCAGAWKLGVEGAPLAARLALLLVEFRRLLDVYEPTHLSLELAFVGANVRSALFLGHARGVILAEAHLRGLMIHEISATAVKKAIVSNGRADKSTLAEVLSRLLGVSFQGLPLDASDALGIAYAGAIHGTGLGVGSTLPKSLKKPKKTSFESFITQKLEQRNR